MTQLKITDSIKTDCQCDLATYCNRHKAQMTQSSWLLCQHGKLNPLLANRSTVPVNLIKSIASNAQYPAVISQIGNFLFQIINRETGHHVPCSACKAEIERLNQMTPAQVLAEIGDLTERIFTRSKDNAQKWTQKLAIKVVPDFVKAEIQKWIREACLMETNKLARSTMRWTYGITTVPSRANDLFPKTLESLMNAGFDSPRIFVDASGPEADVFRQYNLPITVRDNIRTAGHWVLTLWEMWIRDTTAERYAIFQDDFVTVRNLRRYLELVPYPADGYQNLYTFPSNQKLAPKNFTGWYPSDQLGKGAVALVFSKEAVIKLLGQRYLVERFQCLKRGHKAIDGGIVDAMKSIGWKEYVHTHSLVQHTGDKSSMGNSLHLKATSFPGIDYNALDLLKTE